MGSNKDTDEVHASFETGNATQRSRSPTLTKLVSLLHRNTYAGSLLFNLVTFALPALYSTLSKFWVAKIDGSRVATTDVYGYIGIIVEVLNEGLPRAAWTTIGDRTTRTTKSRIELAYTLIATQMVLGLIMTVAFIASASELASTFVPVEIRQTSLNYVRISSVQALSSAIEVAVSASTRALDHPDVPLVISSTKVIVNIILELLLISKFHVGTHKPTVETQAWIRMSCDLLASICGLAYFAFIVQRLRHNDRHAFGRPMPAVRLLRVLIPPGVWTFLESALRNAIYLWLVSGIVSMGTEYATAFGVFITIRWGLIMVPVQALEQSSLAFVGHAWGVWRANVGPERRKASATWRDELGKTANDLLYSAM